MSAALADELPALAEASRTVGSPQIRNRGTIGGNLGTASPAGDALPPLLVEAAEIEVASVRGTRRVPLGDFLLGPKRNGLADDELIVAALVEPSGAPQTFMKVGPRNAMVIAVVSLALVADRERGEIRASFGSAGPVPGLVTCPLDDADVVPDRVAEAASPIDDVRGTAAYRRHALRVLAKRALERCLA
jgi:CO/xanthine dehydrogenase FAD-binding subunit